MIQASLFDELEVAAVAPRVVELCPVCTCCDRVDGLCLGDCATNLHRINRNGSAPPLGGWVDLESAIGAPYPGTTDHDTDDDHDDDDD